ncbi:cation transporter [Solirubrobacter sp. CPCC 204708]|uniref:Cation diffusion facilitator family transporter n=1 Tax=Solirubrobacter deserti TaxID=2282478 RepID=A0ABT4RV08_9ACTN|nr:cation diffusion facilitator family transporter [Solirubrobacter deserti]MBE2319331.1 cation transporter [Solirubrobacter deserti]MDA0142307.1 cation diffusion facilitator family transporter [Solirubrobacter deserti]
MRSDRLIRLLWLSIAAALATITLKTVAYLLTGSIGLLSDAAESVVNLVAAVVAMAALRWARKPADEEHAYGHQKAEYFSAGVEGTLVLVAAVSIIIAALGRLLDPQPIDSAGLGLAVSAGATLINLAVGVVLLRAGRAERSIVVEADGRHLLTDVWTSVGVIAGVAAVALTGWEVLDPLIALAVAVNIVVMGGALVRRSVGGLMDRALDRQDRVQIDAVIAAFREHEGIDFHALRTRQAGSRAFVSVHVLVPGAWTVQHGHDLVERFEDDLRARLPHATIFTHLEPVEDPKSFADTELDRAATAAHHRPT